MANLDPQDNKALNCFVKESKIDNDFKLSLYPDLSKVLFTVSNEVCKTKEFFYRITTHPKLRNRVEENPLKISTLLLGMSDALEHYAAQIESSSKEYSATLLKKFEELAFELDFERKKTTEGDRLSRQIKPYVDKAEKERKGIFESFKKALLDKLLWNNSTLEHSPSEARQPLRDESTVDKTMEQRAPEHKWDDYEAYTYFSVQAVPQEVIKTPSQPATNLEMTEGPGDEVSFFKVD